METLRTLFECLLFFVPRFVNEDVAVRINKDHNTYFCSTLDLVKPGEKFDGITTACFFTWLGFHAPVDLHNRMRPWPKDKA